MKCVCVCVSVALGKIECMYCTIHELEWLGNCFVCIELYEYVPTKSKRQIFITMNLMQFD